MHHTGVCSAGWCRTSCVEDGYGCKHRLGWAAAAGRSLCHSSSVMKGMNGESRARDAETQWNSTLLDICADEHLGGASRGFTHSCHTHTHTDKLMMLMNSITHNSTCSGVSLPVLLPSDSATAHQVDVTEAVDPERAES